MKKSTYGWGKSKAHEEGKKNEQQRSSPRDGEQRTPTPAYPKMKSPELYDPGRQPPPTNNGSSMVMFGGDGSSRPRSDDVPLNRFVEGQASPSPSPLKSGSTQKPRGQTQQS
ncbi:hypothetical protein U1Q18_007353 [Sarracenia purpurea var. burkii]